MGDFFEKTLQRIEAKTSQAPTSLGCHEWMGTLKYKSRYGVIKIHPPGKRIMLKSVHRVKYMCSVRNLDIPSEFDVSHLCHNPKCLNISHLTLERHEVNMQRIECQNARNCMGNHYPLCIFNQVSTMVSKPLLYPSQPLPWEYIVSFPGPYYVCKKRTYLLAVDWHRHGPLQVHQADPLNKALALLS